MNRDGGAQRDQLAMGRTHLDDQDGFKVEEAEQEGLSSVLVLVQKVAHDNQRQHE